MQVNTRGSSTLTNDQRVCLTYLWHQAGSVGSQLFQILLLCCLCPFLVHLKHHLHYLNHYHASVSSTDNIIKRKVKLAESKKWGSTCFCSSPRPSHIEATIFDTSPNVALGFWALMLAWVSLKNKAYADTGFTGSLGSFLFFFFGVLGFLEMSTAAGRFSAPLVC